MYCFLYGLHSIVYCGPLYSLTPAAHGLKNSASKRFENILRVRAKFRLLLSGTPVQNSLDELVSLLR